MKARLSPPQHDSGPKILGSGVANRLQSHAEIELIEEPIKLFDLLADLLRPGAAGRIWQDVAPGSRPSEQLEER